MKYLQQFDNFFEFLFHFLFYYFDKTRLDLALQANDATDSRSQITLTHVKAAFVLNTSSSQSSFWLHTALQSGRDSFTKKMLCIVVVFRAKIISKPLCFKSFFRLSRYFGTMVENVLKKHCTVVLFRKKLGCLTNLLPCDFC